MRNYFKKFALVATIALLVVSIFAFSACVSTNTDPKTVTITIGEEEFVLETNAEYLHDGLLELKEQGKINKYEFSESEYGIFVDDISNLDLSSENSFVAVYHDIDDELLISAGYPVVVDGVTYESSGVGVSSLPLYDGAKYLLKVSTW